MAAAAPRPWQMQAMEAREREKILRSMEEKVGDLFRAGNGLSRKSLSKAEREAKKMAVAAEVKALMREYQRVASEEKTPDYSGMTEDERAAEAERVRQEALKEIKVERDLKMKGGLIGGGGGSSSHHWSMLEDRARLLDFDPKQGGEYYTKFHFAHLDFGLDLDQESPLGPMRYTNKQVSKGYNPCAGINIYSVKISCSDVGFPIHVYGTVIARDSSTDLKCIYLFRRDRDHCQTINSEDESLVLIGPKRGLALLDDDYIETDLKIKDHQGKDRELSKGFLTIRGGAARGLEKSVVETESLETRLSTVDVVYGLVPWAVEGTIAIQVIQGGCFDGQITAHTTGIHNRIVLYDRELYGETTSNDGTGVIQLTRPVVSVSVKEMLVIVAKTRDGKSEGTIEFTPRMNGAEQDVFSVGVVKMHVKVTWSIMG